MLEAAHQVWVYWQGLLEYVALFLAHYFILLCQMSCSLTQATILRWLSTIKTSNCSLTSLAWST
jgi:hypothetical protein